MLALAGGRSSSSSIEGYPGAHRLDRTSSTARPRLPGATSGRCIFGTHPGRGAGAGHRGAVRDRRSRCSSRTTRRGGSPSPIAYVMDLLAAVPERGLRPVGRRRPGAGTCVPVHDWLARATSGFLPFFAGPAVGDRPHHAHRRHRAGDHDPADHHGDLPRGLRPDAAAARGGRAGPRRHPLGDDPARGLPLRPLRHGLGGDARPGPRARRDDGRGDGALRRRRW